MVCFPISKFIVVCRGTCAVQGVQTCHVPQNSSSVCSAPPKSDLMSEDPVSWGQPPAESWRLKSTQFQQ